MTRLAFIVNEPAPYRTHLLRRIVRELPETTLHTLYTSPAGQTSVDWSISEDSEVKSVYFSSAPPLHHQTVRAANSLFHEIVHYLEDHRIDIIFLHGYADLTRLRLIHWAHSAGIPLWIRGDSNIFDDADKPMWKLALKRKALTAVGRRCDGFMAMGTAGRAFFRQYCATPHRTLTCPVEPDYELWQAPPAEATAAVSSNLGLAPSRKRMLFCGRLVAVKRPKMLLDAFAALADQRPEWDLVIAGSGPLESALRARVPRHLESRVFWAGFLQSTELAALYGLCHLLAHPAVKEPWGLIINEAVAAGLPVVTTNGVGAAIELVRPYINGLLVPPDHAPAFLEALRVATEPGVAQAWSVAGREVLADWRRSGDPIAGFREAIELSARSRAMQA